MGFCTIPIYLLSSPSNSFIAIFATIQAQFYNPLELTQSAIEAERKATNMKGCERMTKSATSLPVKVFTKPVAPSSPVPITDLFAGAPANIHTNPNIEQETETIRILEA
ncbi:hypothetical protein Moror_7871 [Moniliophthora roreri MCA 2997]|uniref:Uncharacterized protein n=1 Tax=Moniliophthora roreri (strain MCA 2997) TaxID=1381753 RepID=V2XC41_MONRO|nr:hypothetical protein Moror_7871 [Moniliophthora roreri MCA 2997]